MKNWPKSRRSFWNLLRVRLTREILLISKNIENPDLYRLKFLKGHADYFLTSNDYDLVACPENLDIRIDMVGFSDLFFPEDFNKLQDGLNKLISYYSKNSMEDREEINKWFEKVYDSTFEYACSTGIRSLFFSPPKNDLTKLLKSAQIYLKYVSPSFISLSILVTPSDIFVNEFARLVRSIPAPQNEIRGFSFRYGFTSIKTTFASSVKKADFEELFLRMNKSVVSLFRSNFGAGLSISGPLPCIEVVAINSSLRELFANRYLKKSSKELKACYKLFESLGFPSSSNSFPSLFYSDANWWTLYELQVSELFNHKHHSYQILISSTDYEKSKKLSSNDYFSPSASTTLSYKLHDLLFLLSLEHFYEVLKDMIIDLKVELDPSLSKQSQGIISLKRLKFAMSRMIKINGFYFQQLRVWTGLDEKNLWIFLSNEISKVERPKINENGSDLLRNDIKYRIDRTKDFCENQLELMRLTYEQVLSYKMINFEHGLQKNTFWLSIFVVFLTIITIVPEDMRKSMVASVLMWLKNF